MKTSPVNWSNESPRRRNTNSVLVVVVVSFIAYPLAYYLAKVVNGRILPMLFLILMVGYRFGWITTRV